MVISGEDSPFFVPEYLLIQYPNRVFYHDEKIDEDTYNFLKHLNRIHLCRKKALDLLSFRDHSVYELINKLKIRKFKIDEIEPNIEYLKEKNYLNDERFSEVFLRERVRRKPEGKIFLLKRLQLKGVNRSVSEQVYDKMFDEESEQEICENAYLKAERKYKGNLDKVKYYLQRNGFSYYLIKKILSKYFC